jgi:integrase
MSKQKFPVIDPDFLIKLLGVCRDDEERGLIQVLNLTGMHISSVCKLGPDNIIKRGAKTYITWIRPKTNRTLEALIPPSIEHDILGFTTHKRHSRQHYLRMVKVIGLRAGYEGISPMTFRHNRCIRAFSEGYTLYEVPQVMGCSLEVVMRNYSKLREDQLNKVKE